MIINNHKKNKKTIFNKIFIPIIVVMIVFGLLTGLFQYFSIDNFVKNNAKEKIESEYNMINSSDVYKRRFMIKPDGDPRVLIFDENYNFVNFDFKNDNYSENILIDFIKASIENFELSSDIITNMNIQKTEYLVKLYEAENVEEIGGKYFVILQKLTDKSTLLKESLFNIFTVQFVLYFIILLTVLFVARDIAKPIRKLAIDSNNFAVGKITIDENEIEIKEVDALRRNLYIMQNKVNEEDRAKNVIYENVAHDLRTPLVSILGYADAIKSGIMKDTDKACDIIIRTGTQLKELVENILLISRFDNDTYNITYDEIVVYEKIKEQVETLKIVDAMKKIVIENNAKNDIIRTDKKLFERIIQNLLMNAIKYADEKITIRIVDVEDDKIKISINNDGAVVDSDTLNHIFERYYKGKNGNMGIGLSVVKTAVEALGGEINVKSSEGLGTEFTIIL